MSIEYCSEGLIQETGGRDGGKDGIGENNEQLEEIMYVEACGVKTWKHKSIALI